MLRKLMVVMLLGACAGLQPALVPSQWQVTELAGRSLSAEDRVTMDFAEGRIAGVSGCNRYTGPYDLGEGRLNVGLLAVTRMACAGEAAQIESSFLQTIERVDGYRFERGALVLSVGDEAVMRAQRR
ncbi:MAG: META domain-containing protein [Pararhodobacter sp.]